MLLMSVLRFLNCCVTRSSGLQADIELPEGAHPEAHPEAHPDILLQGWTQSLKRFEKLVSISIDYCGVLFKVDKESVESGEELITLEKKWISEWSVVTPKVVRVYLNHTYDEKLGDLVEESFQWSGHNILWHKDAQGWRVERTGEEVIWLEDPDMLERGKSDKYPFEEDGVTVLSHIIRQEEACRQGFPYFGH